MNAMRFTFDYIRDEYKQIVKHGYEVLTCREYAERKSSGLPAKTVVNRVDVDMSVRKAEGLVDIFNALNIRATFFVRLHAPEYNPFSFENYRIFKKIAESGHEIGYHSEIVDSAAIWNEDAEQCLLRDIDVLNRMLNTKIVGIASHGGITGLNNLDFWASRKAADYGLLYEAYDKQPGFNLFQEAFYVSDSEWTRWKCYNKGKLVENDRRSPAEHLADNHPLLYLLIHPDTYYQRHIYE